MADISSTDKIHPIAQHPDYPRLWSALPIPSMRTTGAPLLAWRRCSSACVPVTAYDGCSVLRLLYPAAVQLIACLSVHCQSSLDRCEDYGRDSAPVRP
jgi:hypothetical protein